MPRPEEMVRKAASATLGTFNYTRSKRGVPMAYCWFGRGKFFRAFIRGDKYADAKNQDDLLDRLREAWYLTFKVAA